MTMTNITEGVETLESLNWEEAKVYFGFIGFICVIFLPAVFGNTLILYVYISKKKHNNTRVYVIFIAVLDMINCLICYPYSVVNCLLPYMFYSDVACKIFTLITYFTNTCVPFSLSIISVDRFRVICRPFGVQICHRMSKILCIVAAIVAIVLSSPSFVFAGSVPIETGVEGIVGRECNSAGASGVLPKVYLALYSLMTILGGVLFTVLYSLMGLALRKQHSLIMKSGLAIHTVSSPSDAEFDDRRRRTLPRSFRPSCESEQDIRVYTDRHKQTKTIDNPNTDADKRNTDIQKKVVFFIEPEETMNAEITEVPVITDHTTTSTRRHSFSAGDENTTFTMHNNNIKMAKSQSVAAIKIEHENAIYLEKIHTNGLVLDHKQTVASKSKKSILKYAIVKRKKEHNKPPVSYLNSSINGNLVEHNENLDGCTQGERAMTHACRRRRIKGESKLIRHIKKKQFPEKEKFNRTKRTTVMFFWVTLVYMVSFLPNPALRVARYLNPDWYADLSLAELTVYYIAHGSVFLVSATNFFIYLFCDTMFRKEINKWYRWVFCRCQRKHN